jgi:malate dehydrogenase (oxaloacetate-decarboxylating)(NADP+)
MTRIRSQPDDISRNLYLQDLHNNNETLYHRILVENMEELAPLVYTPTVGQVCQQFGHQFRRSRGMYFSREDRGMFGSMVYNWPHDDVHVIVVTDGSRILGLGDLGAHGMGIPIGKLALYCAAGGIAPHRVLPVMLDVGTNNQALLDDPLYIGIRKPRLVGDEYFDMIDEFMHAVFRRWPSVVVQFEDFETSKAVPLLEKYRHQYRMFNDDIQGTGCVSLSGILSAANIAKTDFSDLKYLCVGAGSAGIGVCSQLVDAMVTAGLSRVEAMKKFVVMTKDGAIGKADGAHGNPHYSASASVRDRELSWRNDAVSDGDSLLEAVKKHKPTVLLGLSAAGRIFKEEVIRCMASYCDRPIILPLSNPTDRAEITTADAYEWTNGRAIVATGSPFPPYTMSDGRVLIPSQCNNFYIFPGIGLAASVAGVEHITDRMLFKAAKACAESLTPEEIASGRTFPAVARIREVSHAVACAVIEEAISEGMATKIQAKHMKMGIAQFVRTKMYYPEYVPLIDPRLAR